MTAPSPYPPRKTAAHWQRWLEKRSQSRAQLIATERARLYGRLLPEDYDRITGYMHTREAKR